MKLKCVAVNCKHLDIVSSLGTDLPNDDENDQCHEDNCIVVSHTLKLTTKYNGSEIWCRAHSGSDVVKTSSKSLILLQGIIIIIINDTPHTSKPLIVDYQFLIGGRRTLLIN